VVELAAAQQNRVGRVGVRERESQQALVVGVVRAPASLGGPGWPQGAGEQPFVLVDRPLSGADLDRVQLADRHGEEGAPVERIAMQPVARRRRDADREPVVEADRLVGGNEGVLDRDAVRAAALEPDEVAPVVEHREVAARHDRDDPLVAAGNRYERHVMSRVGHARAEVPGAAHAVAAVDRFRARVLEREARRGHEVSVGENLVLRLLWPVGGELERVGRAERQHPAARRAAASDRHDHAIVGGKVDLEAAVPTRHEHPVEAGVAERLVHLLRVVAPRLGRRLPGDEHGSQRVGPGDEFAGSRRRRGRDIGHLTPPCGLSSGSARRSYESRWIIAINHLVEAAAATRLHERAERQRPTTSSEARRANAIRA
jgi:hypothetical protein